MPFVDVAAAEVVIKVVYWGPGCSGKTANLRHLDRTRNGGGDGFIELATDSGRTMMFDAMPLPVGRIDAWSVMAQVYTVPGQRFYRSVRRRVLEGADGIVFVADSLPDALDDNCRALAELEAALLDVGRQLDEIPLVFQYNKQDLEGALSVADLEGILNGIGAPALTASATEGEGVVEALHHVVQLAFRRLRLPRP